jgi:hypothetical protein
VAAFRAVFDAEAGAPFMKVLICGSHTEAALAKEAVYDAGCRPVGPATNPLQALGLADQERPAAALVDLNGIEDGNAVWLAEKLAERGIDLICLSEKSEVDRNLAHYEHTFVAKPAGREALAQCLIACRRRRDTLRRSWGAPHHAGEAGRMASDFTRPAL